MIYYVYVYLDQRKPGKWVFRDKIFNYKPFYVGKGKGDREKQHLQIGRLRERSLKNSKIKSILKETGEEPIHYRIFENITNQESIDIEIEFIKMFGRIDLGTGILTNMTNGGDEIIHSTETKRKIAKTNHKRSINNKIRGVKKIKKRELLLSNKNR